MHNVSDGMESVKVLNRGSDGFGTGTHNMSLNSHLTFSMVSLPQRVMFRLYIPSEYSTDTSMPSDVRRNEYNKLFGGRDRNTVTETFE